MHFTAFDDSDALAKWLAENVAESLRNAIADKGRASLAVSGGTTPLKFFRLLSVCELAWEKVWVCLVDERWVPINSNRSNQRMVTLELLQKNAASAHLFGLYRENLEAEQINEVEPELANLLPFDVLILGMGSDGHTASLFPSGDNLASAVDEKSQRIVTHMNAPDAGETRVTLTLPAIASAKEIILHIEGDTKRQVFEEALVPGNPEQLPIRYVLNKCPSLRVIWAP